MNNPTSKAVVLRAKLQHIERFNHERRRAAHTYSARLSECVDPPFEDGIGTHVYHQYTLFSERRDAIQQAPATQEIASAIYYPIPLHRQSAFAEHCGGLSLPGSEHLAKRGLSLPIYPKLQGAQIEHICDVIYEAALG